MAIESWSRDIALVSLPQGLEDYAELQKVVEMIHQKGGCHVVIDFSEVAIVGSRVFVRLRPLTAQTFRSKCSQGQRFPVSTQNRCSSPRSSRRPSATAGEARIRSCIGFSLKISNSSSTRTAKTTPSSRAA
jgi:hypothetical protein